MQYDLCINNIHHSRHCLYIYADRHPSFQFDTVQLTLNRTSCDIDETLETFFGTVSQFESCKCSKQTSPRYNVQMHWINSLVPFACSESCRICWTTTDSFILKAMMHTSRCLRSAWSSKQVLLLHHHSRRLDMHSNSYICFTIAFTACFCLRISDCWGPSQATEAWCYSADKVETTGVRQTHKVWLDIVSYSLLVSSNPYPWYSDAVLRPPPYLLLNFMT